MEETSKNNETAQLGIGAISSRNTSFISKSIFNEFVEKTNELSIEDKIIVLIDLLNYFDTEKTLIEDEISLELQNDPKYGIKDKMDVRYRNALKLALYKDCEPYLICDKNNGIELNKEQINIIRLINSKIRLNAKRQGLKDNILQIATYNELQRVVVHHDTGYIEVVSDTNLLNAIEGISSCKRKKKKVTLFEKMPICPLCKDTQKRVFYFEPEDIWVCRNCGNEFKYTYNGIEEY